MNEYGALVEWCSQVNTKLFGELPSPSSTLSTINPTWTGLGPYPALCGEGSMANRLIDGTTFQHRMVLILGVLHERCWNLRVKYIWHYCFVWVEICLTSKLKFCKMPPYNHFLLIIIFRLLEQCALFLVLGHAIISDLVVTLCSCIHLSLHWCPFCFAYFLQIISPSVLCRTCSLSQQVFFSRFTPLFYVTLTLVENRVLTSSFKVHVRMSWLLCAKHFCVLMASVMNLRLWLSC